MKNNYKNKVEVTVRAVILSKGKFLLCKHKEKDYYFFPGGHVDFGENVSEALNRELKEELDFSIRNFLFIGAVENFYKEDFQNHHEIILAFKVKVDNLKTQSKENHIEFFLKDKKELVKEKVLPVVLTKAVLKWLKNKKSFWATQIDKNFLKK